MIRKCNLSVDEAFVHFIENEALPGTGIRSDGFWAGLSRMVSEFDAETKDLVEARFQMQKQIDDWCLAARDRKIDLRDYKKFLMDIDYLAEEGPDFAITSRNIDDEISTIPGPQLVVPITNARFAINAVNARWNSLYDALYGTNALGAPTRKDQYDEVHGQKVVVWVKNLLDRTCPLEDGSYSTATGFAVRDSQLQVRSDERMTRLKETSQFVGYTGAEDNPTSILLRHNGIHLELVIDRSHLVGRLDPCGVADVILESAITTILDCEDSVAVVDAADKIVAYRNFLGIMKGELQEEVTKNGRAFVRSMASDKSIKDPGGAVKQLKGRSLLLVRNTAAHVPTRIVLDATGQPVSETLVDALCTTLIALHDIRGKRLNSRTGSIYIVKPKMHGPKEVEQANRVFARVEQILELPKDTIKIGIMDEERRTTVNLKECIRRVQSRLAFINTGFLDRTGDEIHTSSKLGIFRPKAQLKEASWLLAYEDWNVDVGLSCGLMGKAQIGKGMWAMPDLMSEMLEKKIEHPRAGANTAWVPNPTAATLHATHYLRIDVRAEQEKLLQNGRRAVIDTLLNIPLAADSSRWAEDEILQEVRNNLQGILGYVVRWVDQGVGCSKIPDINNVGLMEDRATCRISSQHVVNWLSHGVVTREVVESLMQEMACIVDRQNSDDKLYNPMAPRFDGEAFKAASDLVFDESNQGPGLGYTELVLHKRRQKRKAQINNARSV